jgi:hypothetical protein
LATLGLIIALIQVLEKMIGRAIGERRDLGSLEKRIVQPQKFNVQPSHLIRHGCAAGARGCALIRKLQAGITNRLERAEKSWQVKAKLDKWADEGLT